MKKIGSIQKIILLSGFIFIAWIVYEQFFVPEEARIMELFSKLEEGLEARKSRQVMPLISRQFRDNLGNGWKTVSDLLVVFNRISKSVMISMSRNRIDIKGDTAECEMNFAVKVSTQAQQVVAGEHNDEGSGMMIFDLKQEEGEWKIVGVTYPEDVEIWVKKMKAMISP
ncbi:MAG: hypothetical protein O3B01_09255 [Planctomycetota bacterium]|nr:hypothetical protein [Planctomycetota bacterium]MDA1138755.1 hypothetical protein [Planctomycetota bacterium]